MKYIMILRFWFWNILIALDQLANAVVWGDPKETVSRRAGQAAEQGKEWGCVLCKFLNMIDPRHCMSAQQTLDSGVGSYSVVNLLKAWETGQKTAVTG